MSFIGRNVIAVLNHGSRYGGQNIHGPLTINPLSLWGDPLTLCFSHQVEMWAFFGEFLDNYCIHCHDLGTDIHGDFTLKFHLTQWNVLVQTFMQAFMVSGGYVIMTLVIPDFNLIDWYEGQIMTFDTLIHVPLRMNCCIMSSPDFSHSTNISPLSNSFWKTVLFKH